MWREADGGGDCSQQGLSLSDLIRLFSNCRLPFLKCLPFLILYIWVCMCLWAQVLQRSETPDPPELVVQQWWAPQHGFWVLRSSARSVPTLNYQATAPARDSALQACIPALSSDTARQVGITAAVRATVSERKRKHTEICSTKWKRFSFVSKPWPYCLWAQLASLFILFCYCNRNVNAEGIPLRRWLWAAEHTWHTCGCGVWPALGGIGRRDEGRGGSRESAYLRINERWGVNVNKAFLTSLCAGPAVNNWAGRRSDPRGWGPRRA